MNIDALKKRLDKIAETNAKPLKVVRLQSPPEPDLGEHPDADIIIIREIVAP